MTGKKFSMLSLASLALLASLCIQPLLAEAVEDNPAKGEIVFNEDFQDLQVGENKKWGWKTGAYEFCTRNPKNNKYDNLTTDAMKVIDGNLHIKATKNQDGSWNTGLLTTGDSCDSGGNQFLVKPGDFMLTHVKLPTGNVGAWPGFWTWKDGGNEIDAFEWHSDKPHILEFTNHVNPAVNYYENKTLIGSGKWIYIGVKLGVNSNTWYVGSTKDDLQAVWSDQTGVGANWSAYMIANLSVSSDNRAPKGDQSIDYLIDSIQVFR
jgi:hypothetical protein